jgi:hypothetical protein
MKENDDNNWATYTTEYMSQIIEEYRAGRKFFIKDIPIGEKVEFKDNIHANAKQIYTTIHRLKPSSILECGCGGCYNIRNIRMLLPLSEVHGVDISQGQLSFGKWFSQIGDEGLSVWDVADRPIKRQYELIFTQAVVMHQSTHNAMKMLHNIEMASTKYVLLSENPDHHGGIENWLEMIKFAFPSWELTKETDYGVECYLLKKNNDD